MNPQELFCPNSNCPAKGQTGQGNIIGHGQKPPRCKCKVCGATFSPNTGAAFYRLRHQPSLFVTVITLLAYGCPLQAIVMTFGLDERTVADWGSKAGQQCQAVPEHLVEGADLAGEIQADELRVKGRGLIWWLACALHVPTRLWLGGAVSERRDKSLIRQMMERVKRSVSPSEYILLMTDGLRSYVSQARLTFREKVRTGGRGRPRLAERESLVAGQVIKQHEGRRVTGIVCRVWRGAAELAEKLRHKGRAA
jgi:transposase-like protein